MIVCIKLKKPKFYAFSGVRKGLVQANRSSLESNEKSTTLQPTASVTTINDDFPSTNMSAGTAKFSRYLRTVKVLFKYGHRIFQLGLLEFFSFRST